MGTAILRSIILLALASTATAQTELFFATGVDSTGRAVAQSNADGHVLIESPQYPRGLWLHLVDEAGEALTGIRVEYQGRPDSLVAIHCVDPVGGVQETLVWTRADGELLRLTLKPKKAADLPAGLMPIDWHIAADAEVLLKSVEAIRLSSPEEMARFLQQHWPGKTGQVAVRIDTLTVLAVDLDPLESIERLIDYLQDQARPALEEINTSVGLFLNAQVFKSDLALPERTVILSTSFALLFEDPNLEQWVLAALGRRKGPITLSEAASLIELSISDSSFYSLAGIEHLVALKTLFLQRCDITDVRPLAALTNLESLSLYKNQLTDVRPLAALTKLKTLLLDNNQLTDVRPLAALTNLETLILGFNQLTTVRPLAGLTKLKTLSLTYNQITSVRPLAPLTNLVVLGLLDNQIADVRPLAALTNLVWLELGDNRIADVSPLATLTKLTGLILWYNRIADVSPLATLTNLARLDMDGNQLTDVRPLATLTKLTELLLGYNQITDVSPLANLTNLTRLALYSNQIADVSPLANLTNLTRLELGSNQIEDLAPLVANPGLGEGTAVDVENNPLSDRALTEQIPALQARGVEVRY